MVADLFEGFRTERLRTSGADLCYVVGGSGPPVLLLHGYPQTRHAWHRIAPALAKRFTIVAPDLRGYGESVALDPDAADAYTKRTLAGDLAELMQALGFASFAVVGHDRGARVGYRLALDHPERVSAYASLTVIPTVEIWDRVDRSFAYNAYHWFFLSQPFDLPERLLAADPDGFLSWTLRKMADGRDIYDDRALAAYHAAFRKPSVRHAMCEDYRAAMGADAAAEEADRAAGRRLSCPVLFLHQEKAAQAVPHPLDIWRSWADDVRGAAIAASHMLPEEAPDFVTRELISFFEAVDLKATG
ncbi:alpha/beta fold hydrolase [Azospirillum endophyticum]